MPTDLAALLRDAIDCELPHLVALDETTANTNNGTSGAWTRKQELGHLIDSAANNHMRFVLAAINGEFRGAGYAQDEWVAAHAYGELNWPFPVDLWYRFNTFLAHVFS